MAVSIAGTLERRRRHPKARIRPAPPGPASKGRADSASHENDIRKSGARIPQKAVSEKPVLLLKIAGLEKRRSGIARALRFRDFRAFPDDTRIALEGDKPFARVGPILKLLDGQMVAGLAAGTDGEELAGY